MKIIFNVATHGNENLGIEVVKKIKKLNIDNQKNKLIFQIANEEALRLNKRYIDQDLNQSFPGKKLGNHEEKLAYKLSPIIKSADLVIDIHSTTSNLKNTIIVTKFDNKTADCIKSISPQYALIMSYKKNNALISQAKIGIAFEYGKNKNQKAIKNTFEGIKRLLNNLGVIESKISKPKISTQYYNVISIVPKIKEYKLLKKIKNYTLIKKGSVYAANKNKKLIAEKSFYPILFGEKAYKKFYGFRGEKINIEN
ncbi:MAG: succinylglutamate desuccinylase/aspartoacylase family protein [Candidatus Paceibacterota bacterium]|jgi:succinylglutamate desuccinylase